MADVPNESNTETTIVKYILSETRETIATANEDHAMHVRNMNTIEICDPNYPYIYCLGIQMSCEEEYCGILSACEFPPKSADTRNSFSGVPVGVIDSCYRGEVKAIIWSSSHTKYRPGDICVKIKLFKLFKFVPISLGSPNRGDIYSIRLGQQTNDMKVISFLPNFESIFAPRNSGDAGYDVKWPHEFLVIGPGEEIKYVAGVFYTHAYGPDVILYIFGRSSMNKKGLIVLPRTWESERMLSFRIRNVTNLSFTICKGDRIAQLLVVCRSYDGEPHAYIRKTMFPRTRNQYFIGRPVCYGAEWAKSDTLDTTQRGESGFGSTGT